MDDMLMLEAVERYLRDEMSAEERAHFEHLRRNNPEIDQLVVENAYFFQHIQQFADRKALHHQLLEVEQQMVETGVIAEPHPTGKAKVVALWHRYKRNMAVAASIAAFVSLLSMALMITYTQRYGNENIELLVKKIAETNQEVNKIKSTQQAVSTATPAPKVDYRATGFLIDGNGLIVTNAHVIRQMKNIFVENKAGQYFRAKAVYSDVSSDLAILEITDTAFKTISRIPYSIKKQNADLGEPFFTLGFPRNEIVYGEGYLSAKTGNKGDSSAYQLTVSANPGNSGGPVINKQGELIGIITAKDSDADGVVYAAKSRNILTAVDALRDQDARFQNIKLPNNNDLRGLDRVQQVKKVESFVFMVVGN